MKKMDDLDRIYKPSPNVVARAIRDELIIVPITSGVGGVQDELFTFNETGKALWEKLNGTDSLRVIVAKLKKEYSSAENEIAGDVLGLAGELVKKGVIVAVKGK